MPASSDRAGVVERHARASGPDAGDAVLYYAYGLFKIAVIAQPIHARSRQGLNCGPRFATLDHGVAACARSIDRLFDV